MRTPERSRSAIAALMGLTVIGGAVAISQLAQADQVGAGATPTPTPAVTALGTPAIATPSAASTSSLPAVSATAGAPSASASSATPSATPSASFDPCLITPDMVQKLYPGATPETVTDGGEKATRWMLDGRQVAFITPKGKGFTRECHIS